MQQIETGKYKKKIYNMQHINAYHSRLNNLYLIVNNV